MHLTVWAGLSSGGCPSCRQTSAMRAGMSPGGRKTASSGSTMAVNAGIVAASRSRLSVLVELTAALAAAPTDDSARPARTLQVVLDRSGSMAGDRLSGAIMALLGLVDRLDPADNFGLVAFDDRVELTAG
jgi:hypothetical protein